MTKKQLLWSGFLKTLPYQGGVIPFGILYATIATSFGFPWWLVQLFSLIVFGGSSQLVFIDLLGHTGSPFQAVLGSNIVNARHFIYSAGVSREFSQFPRKWKFMLSYWLTDQLYAISLAHKEQIQSIPTQDRHWFFLGSGLGTWFFWFGSSALGIFFGQLIPSSWNLSFSIPLMFMPLVFSVCKDRYGYLTAALAVIFIYFLRGIPYGLGVVLAILAACILGYLTQIIVEKKVQ